MSLLTREQILAAEDLPPQSVPMPEWGGDVLVREMTLADRLVYEAEIAKDEGRHAIAALLALCVVDKAGAALFTAADIPALERKNPTALLRLLKVAQGLNGLGPAAIASAEKNSESGPAAASPSDLPSNSAGPSANSKAA
jgi:hypothetical protein